MTGCVTLDTSPSPLAAARDFDFVRAIKTFWERCCPLWLPPHLGCCVGIRSTGRPHCHVSPQCGVFVIPHCFQKELGFGTRGEGARGRAGLIVPLSSDPSHSAQLPLGCRGCQRAATATRPWAGEGVASGTRPWAGEAHLPPDCAIPLGASAQGLWSQAPRAVSTGQRPRAGPSEQRWPGSGAGASVWRLH